MVGKMFPFINVTSNPIGGECCWDETAPDCGRCTYSWTKIVKERMGPGAKKYWGPPTLREGELDRIRKLKPEDFAFVVTMRDAYNPNVPQEMRKAIYDACDDSPASILLLTKNPEGYYKDMKAGLYIPTNVLLGATIESDLNYPDISKAPSQMDRLRWMTALKIEYPDYRTFVSIEPVMKFTDTFADKICQIKPHGVAVGYENYGHHIPEPTLLETNTLIHHLEANIPTVYRKTIRRAWDEHTFIDKLQVEPC
jgi:protein gp37